jgi:hypothetical protein
MAGSVLESLGQISDPRLSGGSVHWLVDVVGITILAVWSGEDDLVAVATFAKFRQEWLEQFFELLAGIPSHDTLARLLGWLDPKEFSASLVNWTAAL